MEAKMIGGKIATARKGANMSQAQLAQLLFISPQAVGKWERGESVPDIITFSRLAEVLGVDLNYFSETFASVAPVSATDEATGREQEPKIEAVSPARHLLYNFSGSNLPGSDFAGVTARGRKFNGSALRGSDFAGADLAGSSFYGSDIQKAVFDGANLTDCTFSANSLANASFDKTILVRTQFSASALEGATFTNTELVDAKLVKTDLTKTVFKNCVFNGVDFEYSDMRGVCLDGNTFIGVRFQKAALNEATFKGATLKNVSFLPNYALTNKYYKSVQAICFDGAQIDKLTYASLKGVGADLSKVTTI
ncbi:MAG: pentapeptide repeat-containing protein [Taibaiella sp.]|nr:pentapeptide repeat-containing protein [Taibaiella sp.]